MGRSNVAPILDIENEAVGYLGSIGERNVLVDLKPHLQIKNIDAISNYTNKPVCMKPVILIIFMFL